MENKKDIRIDRLERLKHAVIINETETINYDKVLDFYDTLIDDVFDGKYDDIFLTNKLNGLSEEEKKKTFELARKYKSLCFYEGDQSYWSDSIEGVYLKDYDLVATKLLDNYDFLLGLAKNGEDVLKELLSYQNTDIFDQKVFINYLRSEFVNDELLEKIVVKLSDKNGEYKDFTSLQKALLCLNPKDVLYRIDDNKNISLIPASELLSKIKINLLGEDNDDFHIEDALKNMDIDLFDEIIGIIQGNYQSVEVSRK